MKSQQDISNLDLIHLINQTDDRLSFVDTNYVYRVVNQAYVNAFNKSFDEIIGHAVWEMIGMDTFEHVIKPKLDLALSGKEIRYEAWFDFANGSRAYMVVCYRPSFDAEGNVIGVSVTSTDITEQKKLEEEKLLYEKKVFEQSRTAQLGEMIAFIAHQWRGSLHTINTYLLRLRMEMGKCSNTVSEELFDRCETLFQQLSEHIEEVHSLYRQNDSSKEIKLRTAATQAISLLQPRLSVEHIDIDITIPENYIVSSNNTHLVHVFVVLLENSIDALKQTQQESKQIHINALCENGTITIDFRDNGDGVSAEITHQLFSPGISTKELSEHGYGLYFARQIITSQLGGTISLIPNADGAWFRIIVPICACTVNV
ncbi:ATP-binding protein [Sulfuricurvum sp.]|uniref:ATP-binding protein n=1 Tax=Sulfuricurvum sp. TaxID=2025608 RepID=UPI003BB4DE54